jgi:hypothetical protein
VRTTDDTGDRRPLRMEYVSSQAFSRDGCRHAVTPALKCSGRPGDGWAAISCGRGFPGGRAAPRAGRIFADECMSVVNISTVAVGSFTSVPEGERPAGGLMSKSRPTALMSASHEAATPATRIGRRHYVDSPTDPSLEGAVLCTAFDTPATHVGHLITHCHQLTGAPPGGRSRPRGRCAAAMLCLGLSFASQIADVDLEGVGGARGSRCPTPRPTGLDRSRTRRGWSGVLRGRTRSGSR